MRYKQEEDTMNEISFSAMTVEELVSFFEKSTTVETETIFNISPEKMEKLIEDPNLQGKIREMFKKAMREIEEQESDFIIGRSMEIKNLAEILNISKEDVRETFEKIIERNKKEDPSNCMALAIKENISVNPQEFREIADELLRKANNEKGSDRMMSVLRARGTYKKLAEMCDLGDRKKILEISENPKIYGDKGDNKIIRAASKIFGFKYIKQGRWDIHIGW